MFSTYMTNGILVNLVSFISWLKLWTQVERSRILGFKVMTLSRDST